VYVSDIAIRHWRQVARNLAIVSRRLRTYSPDRGRHPQPAFQANSSSNNYRTDDGGRGNAEDELVVTWRPGAQHYVITVERACAGSEDDTMDHGLACPLMHDIAESVLHASANMSRASRNC